jgi:hypothetical protein
MTRPTTGRRLTLISSNDLLGNTIDPPSFENNGDIIGFHVREASIIHQKIDGLEDDVGFIFRR